MDAGRLSEALTDAVARAASVRFALAEALLSRRLALSSGAGMLRNELGMSAAAAGDLARSLARLLGTCDGEMGRLVLAGALLSPAPETRRPQLVWTAPGAALRARGTLGVLMELLTGASRSVVIVGYSITSGAAPLVNSLAAARRRGARVTVIGDRLDEKPAAIVHLWPSDVPRPDLWTRPRQKDEMSSLHAKVVIVDDRWLLVTSANLTEHGLHANIEMGVLEEGEVAAEASGLVDDWITSGLVTRFS